MLVFIIKDHRVHGLLTGYTDLGVVLGNVYGVLYIKYTYENVLTSPFYIKHLSTDLYGLASTLCSLEVCLQTTSQSHVADPSWIVLDICECGFNHLLDAKRFQTY